MKATVKPTTTPRPTALVALPPIPRPKTFPMELPIVAPCTAKANARGFQEIFRDATEAAQSLDRVAAAVSKVASRFRSKLDLLAANVLPHFGQVSLLPKLSSNASSISPQCGHLSSTIQTDLCPASTTGLGPAKNGTLAGGNGVHEVAVEAIERVSALASACGRSTGSCGLLNHSPQNRHFTAALRILSWQ
jgi:hypothetical protein